MGNNICCCFSNTREYNIDENEKLNVVESNFESKNTENTSFILNINLNKDYEKLTILEKLKNKIFKK